MRAWYSRCVVLHSTSFVVLLSKFLLSTLEMFNPLSRRRKTTRLSRCQTCLQILDHLFLALEWKACWWYVGVRWCAHMVVCLLHYRSIVLLFTQVADPPDGCQVLKPPSANNTWIALIARSQRVKNCTFDVKVCCCGACTVHDMVHDHITPSLRCATPRLQVLLQQLYMTMCSRR